MADEKPALHIDTDWKRQAQEEKKRLADAAAQKAREAAAAPTGPIMPSSSAMPASSAAVSGRGGRDADAGPTFKSLVQSMVAQTLFYLGDIAARGAEPNVDFDRAKNQIETLGILEQKTTGNLTDDELKILDAALYETRTRYVNVASQYL